MVPVPYSTATAEQSQRVDGKIAGCCPRCGERFVRSHRTLACEGCGHVPNHGAD